MMTCTCYQYGNNARAVRKLWGSHHNGPTVRIPGIESSAATGTQ